MEKKKPDLSHLRVWGCQCFILIPQEKHSKGGPKRFEAIFVGYEEDRLGWRVHDLSGKYFFSRDVIFNENIRGSLKHSSPSPQDSVSSDPEPAPTPAPLCSPSPRPQRPIKHTSHGADWSKAIQIRDSRLATRRRNAKTGGVHPQQTLTAITDFASLVSAELLPDRPDDLLDLEPNTMHEYKCLAAFPDPLRFRHPRLFDLTKPPNNYHEAMARPDSDVWHAVMVREHVSLQERGVFQATTLPPGRKAIGVRWVYDYKLHPDGSVIHGKEKARLVAQGFSQRPEDYGETYAPVAKMTSIRIIIVYAASLNLLLMCCDAKTAFLNALLGHTLYCKQIPGFLESDPSVVYLVLRALYGLKQSSFEWYNLL